MATGGFGQNPELKRMYLTRPLEYTGEPDTITGDGHLMGQAVGAQLVQLDAWWMPHLRMGAKPQGSREDRIMPAFDDRQRRRPAVRQRGHQLLRPSPEGVRYQGGRLAAQSCRPGCSSTGRPVTSTSCSAARWPPGETPPWLEGPPDTVAGLAEQIGVDPAALEATVERFNGFAQSGVDEDFARGENDWDKAWGRSPAEAQFVSGNAGAGAVLRD